MMDDDARTAQTPMAQTPMAQTPMAQTPMAQTPMAQTPTAETLPVESLAALVGCYVRTRHGVDGHEPHTLGVVGAMQRDGEGRARLAVYWRPELQCAGEAAPSWYGPGAHPLDDLELLPSPR